MSLDGPHARLSSRHARGKLNLFIPFYDAEHPVRREELEFCLRHNFANPWLKTYVLRDQNKPTFRFMFDYASSVCSAGDVNIIANADIYFDDTILLARALRKRTCYALTRYERVNDRPVLFWWGKWSQDVWIFRGKIDANVYADIAMGERGCDNRLAFELAKAGYVVKNPSLSIRCHHAHASRIRTHSEATRIPEPYKLLQPVVAV